MSMFDVIASVLLHSMFILSPVIFISLFFITAPYGRHVHTLPLKGGKAQVQKSMSKKLSFPLLSKRTGWLIMEIPAVLTIFILWCISDVGIIGLVTGRVDMLVFLGFAIFIFIWEFHYLYRTFIFTYLFDNKKNEFRFYVPFMGLLFNIINGYINGWFLFFQRSSQSPQFLVDANLIYSFLVSPTSIVGIVLFFIGFYIHVQSDRELRRMKKVSHNGYGIPQRFLHTYVASPNYFGEILQWWGWALLTWSIAGVAFALFTMANLVPRAFANLTWYRNTFSDYPKNRKAIIPFIM